MKKVSMQEMNRQQELKDEAYAREQEASGGKTGIGPLVGGAAVFAVAAVVLSVIPGISGVIGGAIGLALGVAAGFAMASGKKKKSVVKVSEEPEKTFADEIAQKIMGISKDLGSRAEKVQKAEVRNTLNSMTETLEKIADEVERDPKDRNKVRKLANHYGGMITELADKYLSMQDKAANADGENIAGSLEMLEKSFADADLSLRKMLDSLFSEDAMAVTADIGTLDALLTRDVDGQQVLEMRSLEK